MKTKELFLLLYSELKLTYVKIEPFKPIQVCYKAKNHFLDRFYWTTENGMKRMSFITFFLLL